MALRRPHWTFWIGTPVCLLSLMVLPLLPWREGPLDLKMVIIGICWTAGCVLPPFALYDSRRFWWATRTLTAMIFVAYIAYFVEQWFFPVPRRSNAQASPENSLIGLFVFALPALWYTIFGRLTFRKPQDAKDGPQAVTVEQGVGPDSRSPSAPARRSTP